jgi:FixJ family two-component response regulator
VNKLVTAWEAIGDSAGTSWSHFMNESRGVPIIGVIDDDEGVRESLAGLAESVGYETALFASGEEFLESAAGDGLACLILDVRLPGMSGIELYTQLARSLRAVPTVFITAHADAEMGTWVLKAGGIALLYKPFQPEVLLAAVRKAIIRSRH